jgi:hypothetical protein
MAQISLDRRRINGPEDSFPLVFLEDDGERDSETEWKPGKPRHGRLPLDIRPICRATNSLSFFVLKREATTVDFFFFGHSSFTTGTHKSSQWIGLHRNRTNKNRVCSVAYHVFFSHHDFQVVSSLRTVS